MSFSKPSLATNLPQMIGAWSYYWITKFCKQCMEGKSSCGVATNAVCKAKVDDIHLYIKETDTKAFIEPKLKIALLSEDQVKLLLSKTFSKEFRGEIIIQIGDGNLPDWLQWYPTATAVDQWIDTIIEPVFTESIESP